MNNRHYWKNRMTPVGRSRRFTASSTRNASQKYEIKTTGKPTPDPNVNSLNIDDKYMETTSSVKNEKTMKKVTVETCPHQKDPRLSAIVAKSSETFLKILKWNSISRSLNMNILDNTLVTRPVSPKDESASSIIKSSKSDHPNRPNSIKKTRVIMNEKFVCQCNRSVLNKFCGISFPTLKFCCHVYIKKGECDSIGESYNNINFLDSIDTRQSYLFPVNIPTISALNLEEHISENLQNESKQVAVFDEEQDEEIKFVPETVIDFTRNTTEDIVKNSADDIIVLADKIVPKELFMQIYNTKPKKVSAAPLSLDKVNHKDPLNSNSEMGKKKIVISAPKSSSTKLDNSIRKKLYDPESDFDVCEKRLLELFDDDLSASSSDSNGSLGDTLENATGSKFLGKSNLRRKYPFKQASLTCEDAYMTPKKISNRRKTTYFSSFSKDTEISKNNIPAVSCLGFIAETLPLTTMSNASNHLEQLKQLETSQSTINNLSGTSESSACASVAAETIQLIAKEIAITDVSNHSQKMKQIETLKNTSQHGDVIGSEIISNFELIRILEDNSDHDQQVVVPRNENKFSKITTSPSYISPENNLEKYSARFALENENQLMSEFLEKEVTERAIEKSHEELEFCMNLKDFKKGGEEYFNSIHALTQMESRNENGQRDVNMKISCPPFSCNGVKRKKLLSMPKLEETERRQIKKKALRDITELTLKFATSLEIEDECNEEVMFICDRPSIEPSFAVYIQPAPNSSDQNQSHNTIELGFYPDELGRIYYQFNERVVYILKGYIPLQKAYSESFKVIHETLRRFPHSYNNLNTESLSLSLNLLNRRKLYSRYLLEAVLKLPTDLPQFHFSHFFKLTTELLNRSGIPISIPVVVHHLLAVVLACHPDYEKNKTSDKFKKNLESFSDTFNNKNGTNQPEIEMTMTQRYLLTTQNLTFLQLHQNQKTCSESSKRLHHDYSRQQHDNLNNIQQTFGTCRNENPTYETQHSVIQNSNQSYRSSEPMQYPNLESILNKNSSDVNQLENNSISKHLSVGPSRVNQPQSNEMTTPSTSEVVKLKTQSSGNHKSADSNADIPYTVKKKRTPLNECNIDVINKKSSNEAKKYESSDNCVDSVGCFQQEIAEKLPFCEDEMIDLTWMDDFTEEELRKEDYGHECIKNEPPVICTKVMEYPILENRLCLCGKMAIHLCHCNTAMYCSQKCQFTDWPKHRKGCLFMRNLEYFLSF